MLLQEHASCDVFHFILPLKWTFIEALPEKPVQNLEMGGQPIGFILSGQSRSRE